MDCPLRELTSAILALVFSMSVKTVMCTPKYYTNGRHRQKTSGESDRKSFRSLGPQRATENKQQLTERIGSMHARLRLLPDVFIFPQGTHLATARLNSFGCAGRRRYSDRNIASRSSRAACGDVDESLLEIWERESSSGGLSVALDRCMHGGGGEPNNPITVVFTSISPHNGQSFI